MPHEDWRFGAQSARLWAGTQRIEGRCEGCPLKIPSFSKPKHSPWIWAARGKRPQHRHAQPHHRPWARYGEHTRKTWILWPGRTQLGWVSWAAWALHGGDTELYEGDINSAQQKTRWIRAQAEELWQAYNFIGLSSKESVMMVHVLTS